MFVTNKQLIERSVPKNSVRIQFGLLVAVHIMECIVANDHFSIRIHIVHIKPLTDVIEIIRVMCRVTIGQTNLKFL